MSERSGPFWDSVDGRIPLPRAAATLGFELVADDPEQGTIEVAFTATEDFTTPRGDVLEGFLAAMLHDVLGPALLATLEPHEFIVTNDLQARFLRPAYPGRISGRGRVLHRDGDVAAMEATLFDPSGEAVATGSATARVIELSG